MSRRKSINIIAGAKKTAADDIKKLQRDSHVAAIS
jgi:hypothetical protein